MNGGNAENGTETMISRPLSIGVARKSGGAGENFTATEEDRLSYIRMVDENGGHTELLQKYAL